MAKTHRAIVGIAAAIALIAGATWFITRDGNGTGNEPRPAASVRVTTPAGGGFTFSAAQAGTELIPPTDRRLVPGISGKTLVGKPFDTGSTAGRVLVLNFWASWCAPCREEMPGLEQTHQEFTGRGVDIVGVNINDGKSAARALATDLKITYPSIYDRENVVAESIKGYPSQAIPTSIVVDRSGRVAAVYLGPVTPQRLQAILDTLLSEP